MEAATHHRHWPWIVGAVVFAVTLSLVGGGLWFRAWLKETPETVTVGQALDRYRSTGSEASSSAATAGAAVVPGVYVYATTGAESVDALGGDAHSYPNPTTMTVTATQCGYEMSWIPVSGRSDVTDVCRDGAGLTNTTTANAHEFFHMSEAEHFVCDGAWWLPPPGTTTWSATCRGSQRTIPARAT